jgi:hypothetical protein
VAQKTGTAWARRIPSPPIWPLAVLKRAAVWLAPLCSSVHCGSLRPGRDGLALRKEQHKGGARQTRDCSAAAEIAKREEAALGRRKARGTQQKGTGWTQSTPQMMWPSALNQVGVCRITVNCTSVAQRISSLVLAIVSVSAPPEQQQPPQRRRHESRRPQLCRRHGSGRWSDR